MLTATDVMNRNILTISPEKTVSEATALLLENGVSGLPVVDDTGCLVGVITEFAMMALAYNTNHRLEKVSQHMTTDLITVEPEMSITQVADTFIVNRVRRLPVLDHGVLVGLISRRDVLKAVFQPEPAAATN